MDNEVKAGTVFSSGQTREMSILFFHYYFYVWIKLRPICSKLTLKSVKSFVTSIKSPPRGDVTVLVMKSRHWSCRSTVQLLFGLVCLTDMRFLGNLGKKNYFLVFNLGFQCVVEFAKFIRIYSLRFSDVIHYSVISFEPPRR